MTHDAPKHIIKVFPGIDLSRLARLDQTKEQGRSSGASLTADEQPVLSSQSQRANRILGCVIVWFEAAIIEIAAQGFTLIQGIVDTDWCLPTFASLLFTLDISPFLNLSLKTRLELQYMV